MSNIVYNRIICTKAIFKNYFLDYTPFGEEEKRADPYVSFNKLFGLKSLEEYDTNKYGVYIYYGDGCEYNEIANDKMEIKFNTLWDYPIKAIMKAIELFKEDIEWYAVEQNLIYISKFYWNNKVVEEILELNDRNDFEVFNDSDPEPETPYWVWDYKPEEKKGWKIWECDDFEKRYLNSYSAETFNNELESINTSDDERKYYYLTVQYEDDYNGKDYNYISEDETVQVGDTVLVDRAGELAFAEVTETGYYNKFEAPYPVYLTKKIIKKMDNIFDEDNIPENVLHMNVDGTDFEFGIFDYVKGENNDDNWSTQIVRVNNGYFNYLRNAELMTSAEVDRLSDMFEKLINNELKEKDGIGFYEPDLEFEFYPATENEGMYAKMILNLTDKVEDGTYIDQQYVMGFGRKEIEEIAKYIQAVRNCEIKK